MIETVALCHIYIGITILTESCSLLCGHQVYAPSLCINPHPVMKKILTHVEMRGRCGPIPIPVKRYLNAWQGTLMCPE